MAIDVKRFGPFVSITINGFVKVAVADGIAKDGVLHVVPAVLIPPKAPGGPGAQAEFWDGESEMSVEEFQERLEPYVTSEKGEERKIDL